MLCSADSDETLEALELRYASKMTASSVEASLSLRSSMCCGASSNLSLSFADSRLSSLDWNSEDSSLLLRVWLEEPWPSLDSVSSWVDDLRTRRVAAKR